MAAMCLLAVGCGYSYAGNTADIEHVPDKDQEVIPTQTKAPTEEKTVTIRTNDDIESPCGVEAFNVYYMESNRRMTKRIDCRSGTVLEMRSFKVSENDHRHHVSINLPTNAWYLLVDPTGTRADYVSNDELLKLSKYYSVKYHDRVANSAYIVYTFLGRSP